MLKFNWDTPASVEIHDGSAWRTDEGRVEIQDGTVTLSAGSPVAGVRLFYETEFEKNAREVFGKLPEEYPLPPPEIEIDGLTLEALWEALKRVQERAPKETEEVVFQLRNIHRENFTVEGCMETIESRLSVGTVRFSQLFSGTPDREEVVTLFMALLELLKLGKAHVMQTGNFGEMTLLPGRRESDLGEE